VTQSRKPTPVPAQPLLDAWGVAEDLGPFDSGWSRSAVNKVIYASSGVLHLQVGDARWLLPPQRAAWIRAGTEHRITAAEPVSLRTVHVASTLVEHAEEVSVFEVNGLAREMMLSSVRWGDERDPADRQANAFFVAFAALLSEWIDQPRRFRLPNAQSPELQKAMQHALQHLQEEPSIEDAARLAGVSPRTLARRFRDEAGTTWREFLHNARMMRAMELLADRQRSVTDTAYAVGFNSLGAFTRAFVDFTGERPRDYHKRVTDHGE
jgi:transcriptional regulator GlxA family with amidase domain